MANGLKRYSQRISPSQLAIDIAAEEELIAKEAYQSSNPDYSAKLMENDMWFAVGNVIQRYLDNLQTTVTSGYEEDMSQSLAIPPGVTSDVDTLNNIVFFKMLLCIKDTDGKTLFEEHNILKNGEYFNVTTYSTMGDYIPYRLFFTVDDDLIVHIMIANDHDKEIRVNYILSNKYYDQADLSLLSVLSGDEKEINMVYDLIYFKYLLVIKDINEHYCFEEYNILLRNNKYEVVGFSSIGDSIPYQLNIEMDANKKGHIKIKNNSNVTIRVQQKIIGNLNNF